MKSKKQILTIILSVLITLAVVFGIKLFANSLVKSGGTPLINLQKSDDDSADS